MAEAIKQTTVRRNGKRAVVIGSGFGGLAAAIRLGARGYDVTVLEKKSGPGGRAFTVRKNGYTFDCGPTVVTADFLFEELWQLCGRSLRDEVELRRVEPCYEIRFHDGKIFQYLDDPEGLLREVERIAPGDVEGVRGYLKMSEQIFKVGFLDLSDMPFDSVGSMLKIAPAMMRLESYRTVYGLISKFVKNEQIRQVLSFHTLLVGGNPFTTTAIYALISHVESTWGVTYPKGGMSTLVQGMVSLVEGQGNSVRYNAEVQEIEVQGRKVTGVRLANGEVLPADIVVSNADAAFTYKHLLPEHVRRRWTNRRIDRMRYSMSLFVWYFGTDKQYTDVKHHTILMGPRYKALLDDIFKRKVLADDFSLYLHRPTATDPDMAPEGCDTFYVLSPVPDLDSGVDWSVEGERYRLLIQRALQERLLPDLDQHIVESFTLTPQGFLDDLLSLKGAAFGPQPILTQSAYFRPHNKSEDVEGLYLVGAGTHPGAGLPGVLSSAKVLERVLPDVGHA
ncbi:MAG: phytoene desaturase [Pseudomonadota bacterium]